MSGVRVFDIGVQDLSYVLANLTNLKYLGLESFGNLKRLHTLDLPECSGLKSLPKSIGTLGLKTLLLDGCSDELLDQASSLVNYSQTLPLFKVRADEFNGCSNLPLLEGAHVTIASTHCLHVYNRQLKEWCESEENKANLAHINVVTCREQVVRYTMHDLVHDLARLTMDDKLIDFNAQQRNTRGQKYCRYSLLKNYNQTIKLASILPSKIRALRFSDSGELHIQSGAFSFANCLRILDFSECSGILLPASIGKLKQLRCLIAPRMQNESLPECITELGKLQYLNINGSSQISALPESIGKLGCLKYLCLSGCSSISKLPESFGDLKCMVHLDMSGCSGIRELEDWLGKLRNLQHLDLSGCSSVKAIPEPLCGLTQLQYLDLSSCQCLDRLPEAIGSLMDLQYLNMHTETLPTLPRHLVMSCCFQIRELPESLMMLQNLLHLDLSFCTSMSGVRVFDIGVQDLSYVLANLTNLKYLGLGNSIIHGRGSYVFPDGIGGLTNLEHLNLSYNYNIASLPESFGNLKRLHTLDLPECSGLKSLPKSIGTLGLKTLLLDGCSDELLDQASSLVNYSQTLPLFKVRADEFNGCSNLPLLEGAHVSELRIRCLENVRSLEEATKVKLSGKYNLSKLTLAWSTERAEQFLKDKDLLGQLVPPKGLKHMHLQGYNCTRFPGWLMDISCYLTNLVYIRLQDLPTCSNLPPLAQLRHLENLELFNLPGIKRIDREFCGGKGAFRRLSHFWISEMDGLEEWNTTYCVEEGVEEFMFPVLDYLSIDRCPRLRLKPCPPTFLECYIGRSDQVISSLEEVDKISHHCSSSSPAIKLHLAGLRYSCQSIRIFHHFPLLRDLRISADQLTSPPESMRHVTSLESLTLDWCDRISALPEWLGDLSSLKSHVISRCDGIKSLPACIQQLTKLQKLEIWSSPELKKWCDSEENKTKLAHINLRKRRATYQRCMTQVFGEHIERTVEAYMDDIVVKSRKASDLIDDLEVAFKCLKEKGINLNREKSEYGVASIDGRRRRNHLLFEQPGQRHARGLSRLHQLHHLLLGLLIVLCHDVTVTDGLEVDIGIVRGDDG
ncbi:uncharacterized protein [Miscanthus floridulus]|uniref:uncharacterized protein n=1 Tax=Miscanthus floridulus TaxID=154761 RepID=UPI0034593C5B